MATSIKVGDYVKLSTGDARYIVIGLARITHKNGVHLQALAAPHALSTVLNAEAIPTGSNALAEIPDLLPRARRFAKAAR